MNRDQTCETCRYSTNESRVCRRYPPVPLLAHSGSMWVLKKLVMGIQTNIVESAVVETHSSSTCGEWRPRSVEPQLAEPSQELQHLIETMQVLWGK